jgi:hypothetical protein
MKVMCEMRSNSMKTTTFRMKNGLQVIRFTFKVLVNYHDAGDVGSNVRGCCSVSEDSYLFQPSRLFRHSIPPS